MKNICYVPSDEFWGELVEKKSRFISSLAPVKSIEDCKKIIASRRSRFKNAKHHPWAYILEGQKKYSDDGEPTGTSGRPILACLERESICGAIIVVSRIFGGIKLGASGLTRAYIKAAKLSLEAALFKKLVEMADIEVTCEYGTYESFKTALKSLKIFYLDESFTEKVLIHFSIEKKDEGCLEEIILKFDSVFCLKIGERKTYIDDFSRIPSSI
ncbi:YigZ family protein [candidate division WOR-3 bacterium]|nr:YigZ family protein [candidate division WOR-3 bacterium]